MHAHLSVTKLFSSWSQMTTLKNVESMKQFSFLLLSPKINLILKYHFFHLRNECFSLRQQKSFSFFSSFRFTRINFQTILLQAVDLIVKSSKSRAYLRLYCCQKLNSIKESETKSEIFFSLCQVWLQISCYKILIVRIKIQNQYFNDIESYLKQLSKTVFVNYAILYR